MNRFAIGNSRLRNYVATMFATSLMLFATAKADEYSIHFLDPVGDNYAPYFDVTGMDFNFDPATGAYHGRFYTTEASPFPASAGRHYFNLSLLNLRRQSEGLDSVTLAQAGLGIVVARTALEFEGVNAALTTWLPGDEIAPSQSELIGQSGLFPSLYAPWSSPADFLGAALIVMDPMWINQTAVVQVPEPSMLWMAGLWIGALAVVRRQNLKTRPSL